MTTPVIRVGLKDYLARLDATVDQFKTFTQPMLEISKNWSAAVRGHFGSQPWAALDPDTVTRWGAHPLLRRRGDMFDSIQPWSRSFAGGAYAIAPHGPLHDRWGRKAGSGTARTTKVRRGRGKGTEVKRAGRLLRGEKRSGYDIGAEGRIAWGAMPARPFMFVDEKMDEFAMTTLSDYVTDRWDMRL